MIYDWLDNHTGIVAIFCISAAVLAALWEWLRDRNDNNNNDNNTYYYG